MGLSKDIPSRIALRLYGAIIIIGNNGEKQLHCISRLSLTIGPGAGDVYKQLRILILRFKLAEFAL